MFTFLAYYLMFAIATSITFLIVILNPVHKQLKINYPDDLVSQNPITNTISSFIQGLAWAPLHFIVLLSKKASNRFYNNYYTNLHTAAEKAQKANKNENT